MGGKATHVDIPKSGYWLCPKLASQSGSMPSTTIATHLCLFLCAMQSIKIQLSTYFCLATPMKTGLEDKKRQELDFFLTTLWCASNKCPNYTQPIHTMTHKHLCFHEGAQMYLKKTDSLLYYCQGEARSEKKVMSGKHQPSNVYAQVWHLLKIWNNLLLVLLKKTTTSLIRESYKVRRCSIRQCQGLHVIIQMTTSSSNSIL